MWHDLTVALALLLLRDAQLRFAGLTSMLLGLALLYIVNH